MSVTARPHPMGLSQVRTIIALVVGLACVIISADAPAGDSSDRVVVLELGQWAPMQSADRHVVPGVAGSWLRGEFQAHLRDEVLAKEHVAAPDCTSPRVSNSRVATPDIQWNDKTGLIAVFALQIWTVDRCGTEIPYHVLFAWPVGRKVNYSIQRADDLKSYFGQPLVDSKLKELVVQREAQRAAGAWEDLNLPMPPAWKVAFYKRNEQAETAIFEMLPQDEELENWRSMITAEFMFGSKRPSPQQLLDDLRELHKQLCGSEQESAGQAGDGSVTSAQVLLVCERVSKTDYAEVTLGKAISGKQYLYYVHLSWRTAAGDRATVLEALDDEISEGRKLLDAVRICDAARDLGGCESPFFL